MARTIPHIIPMMSLAPRSGLADITSFARTARSLRIWKRWPDLQPGGHVGGATPAENDDGKDDATGKQGINKHMFPMVLHG